MTLGVRQMTTGMGVQSPHPFGTDRHNDTPKPTGRTYLGSDRKMDAKHRMGDSGPQILTSPPSQGSRPHGHYPPSRLFCVLKRGGRRVTGMRTINLQPGKVIV